VTKRLIGTVLLGIMLAVFAYWLSDGAQVGVVHAEGYTVTKLTDSNDGVCDADCSLREAIIAANADPDPDTITLGPGTHTLTITGTGEDLGATGDLDITTTVTLVGMGPTETTIDASGLISDRVLHIRPISGVASVVISGVAIVNGNATGSGGGIASSQAALTLTNVYVLDNWASQHAGGVFASSTDGHFTWSGDMLIRGNVASSAAGGVYLFGGEAHLQGGRVISNSGRNGGGIQVRSASIELASTRVESNTSSTLGGGIHIADATATLTATDGAVIAHNQSQNGGGGIHVLDGSLVIVGGEISHNATHGGGGGLYIEDNGRLVVERTALIGNQAISGTGGGIRNRGESALTNVTLSANTAFTGAGGIQIDGGVMTATYVTIADNHAVAANPGGAIYVAGGAAMLQDTIISNNGPANCVVIGSLTSLGHNLESGTSCGLSGTGDITDTDPSIGPLAQAGATWVHPLPHNSPAVDAGLCVAGSAIDQRGLDRPQGIACDIGSYEYLWSPPANFIVTKLTDSNDGTCDADCSLREAIIAANADPGPDTVTLGPGSHSLTITGEGEDGGATGDLDVTYPMTLVGQGPDQTIIDASGLAFDRVVDILPADEGATVVVSGVAIVNGHVSGWGGGVYAWATDLTIVNVHILSNTATGHGGGVAVEGSAGKLTFLGDVVVVGNAAGHRGGGVYVENIAARLRGGRIISNSAEYGGGIAVVEAHAEISGSLVVSNSASYGGGIYIDESSVALQSAMVLSNTSDGGGGGGIYVATGSSLTATATAIVHNEAAIDSGGGILNRGRTTLLNTTVSGNVAAAGGGGLHNDGGAMTATFTTVAGNSSADAEAGDGLFVADGSLVLHNTIVAGNGLTGCQALTGTLESLGHNLDSGTSCGLSATGDITNTDTSLGPLTEDNGTWVHPLPPDSSAVDAGECITEVTGDQRGAGRPQGVACDIGAYEFAGASVFLPLVIRGG